jgi:hypothetical protein
MAEKIDCSAHLRAMLSVMRDVKQELYLETTQRTVEAAKLQELREVIPALTEAVIEVLPQKSVSLISYVNEEFWLEYFPDGLLSVSQSVGLAEHFLFSLAAWKGAYSVSFEIMAAHEIAATESGFRNLETKLNELVGTEEYDIVFNQGRISFHESRNDNHVAVAIPLTEQALAIMKLST